MIREIGSEFEYEFDKVGEGISFPTDKYSLTFSGRTAIEMVLKANPQIKKALLPSYCCGSMIAPFIKAGIEISYYEVDYKDGFFISISISDDVDALLWCNYFGFRIKMPDLSDFKNRGGIVIEDITHSFYSENKYDFQSDYLVASLRKWEALTCGGFFSDITGKASVETLADPSKVFTDEKIKAMKMKTAYLANKDACKKDIFLDLFNKSNDRIRDSYSGIGIDEFSSYALRKIEFEKHRTVRRENANVLMQGLKDCGTVRLLFDADDADVPLFVPVVIEKGRDEMKAKLIANDIYCPVHWPKASAECRSSLYDIELSLICDHRYSVSDMERIIKVING